MNYDVKLHDEGLEVPQGRARRMIGCINGIHAYGYEAACEVSRSFNPRLIQVWEGMSAGLSRH